MQKILGNSLGRFILKLFEYKTIQNIPVSKDNFIFPKWKSKT